MSVLRLKIPHLDYAENLHLGTYLHVSVFRSLKTSFGNLSSLQKKKKKTFKNFHLRCELFENYPPVASKYKHNVEHCGNSCDISRKSVFFAYACSRSCDPFAVRESTPDVDFMNSFRPFRFGENLIRSNLCS
jgi:hypothetical protein